MRILIEFSHGLGDAVQLTSVLAHLRRYHPDWQIDVATLIGKHSALAGLADRVFILEREQPDKQAYDRIFALDWWEADQTYAGHPATKAEKCLREVFHLQPIAELCRYTVSIGPDALAVAKSYLESICASSADGHGRYSAVLLHYQANTASDKKDLPHGLAKRICEVVIESGRVPIILDWDRRSPLPDGKRIFNPDADAPLWGGMGTGDCEVLAALIAQSSLVVGVDSGPLHVAAAVAAASSNSEFRIPTAAPTPTIAVWTGHHPLHYFGLADHVTHLVPGDHASRLRGDPATGLAFFQEHYRHHTYRQLANELPAYVVHLLTGEDFDRLANKEFLRQLSAKSYDENYYLEHKLAGLDYLAYGPWQEQYGRWLVDSLTLKGKRVLDVGCACGSVLRGLGEAGAVVQGVDLCEAMVRRGREAWPELAASLHVCDAVNLHAFADGAFDAIHTSQAAEHWKPDLVQLILRELARVTVPGGLLFCALDTEELFARQGRTIEHEDPTHICIRPLSWWRRRLAECGWELCTAEFEARLRAHPETFLMRYDWDWFVARRSA